jgi:hypothetical protein
LLRGAAATTVGPHHAVAGVRQQHEPGDSAVYRRLTPVDLHSGEAAGSVTFCEGYQFGGMAFAADGASAVAAVRCDDSDVPTLFTLR